MWICIPDEDGKDPWTGTLSRSEGSSASWKFELIRHVEQKSLYDTTPFNDQRPVIGLLDYQVRCTLIRPIVTVVDPGSVGVLINFLRIRIEGICDALLTGLPISSPTEACFLSLSFKSEAFTIWYAPPVHRRKPTSIPRTPEIEIKPDKTDAFLLPGLGRVECTIGAEFSDEGVYSMSITSTSLFRLGFETPRSLEEIYRICFGLERLFGFLIGHRGTLPEFKIQMNKKYRVGGHEIHHEGTLDIGGYYHVDRKPPHPMRCIHLAHVGAIRVEKVVTNFLDNQSDLLTRMHAVEFCRFFSSNLNDQFSVIMPVLEEFLKERYSKADEISYLQNRSRFFDYVDKSQDEAIREFARKHLVVKDDKSPSLATLIGRAIDYLNAKGFVFSPTLAKQIQQRRGKMFHSTPDMSEADVGAFQDEIIAATAIVLLHTFEDVGVDPSLLKDSFSALSDMQSILPKPKWLPADPSAPAMTLVEAAKLLNDDVTPNEPGEAS